MLTKKVEPFDARPDCIAGRTTLGLSERDPGSPVTRTAETESTKPRIYRHFQHYKGLLEHPYHSIKIMSRMSFRFPVYKYVRIFIHGTLNRVHNAPWLDCPNVEMSCTVSSRTALHSHTYPICKPQSVQHFYLRASTHFRPSSTTGAHMQHLSGTPSDDGMAEWLECWSLTGKLSAIYA